MTSIKAALAVAILFAFGFRQADAAIAFNWQNNAYNQAAAASATVTKGSNTINQNDLLIAVVCALNFTTDPGTISTPSGWTILASQAYVGTSERCASYYKVAGASESGSYSFSWTNSDVYSWALLDYTGVNSTTPLDGTPGNTNQSGGGFSPSLVAPSITPTGASDTLISIFTLGAGGTVTCGTGCSLTMRVNQSSNNSSSPWIGVGDLALTSSGATATETITYSSSVNWYQTWSIALAPGAGGGGGVSLHLLGAMGAGQ